MMRLYGRLALIVCAAQVAAASSVAAQEAATPETATPDLAVQQEAPTRVLTLDEAVAAARANQPDLRRAAADVAAADARSDQARSGLLPSLRASAGYQLSTSNSPTRVTASDGTVISQDVQLGSRWDFGVSASQLIWDFGQTMARRRAAQAQARAQRSTAEASGVDVVLNVRMAYFVAAAQRALAQVAQESLDNQLRHLDQIQAFVEVERQPAIDLAQARADVANARVQLIQAQNQYELAKVELNQAMGVETGTDYDVALDTGLAPVASEEAEVSSLVQEAYGERPELAALDDRLLAQGLSVDAARAGRWPTLSLSTGLTESGSALDEMAWNWYVGLSLDWRFYQGGLIGAQVREAEANLSGLEADRDNLRHSIRVEVERARLSVASSAAALEAAGEAVTNARERLRLAEGRYEAGVGSILELSDAQLALTNAEVQQVQASFDVGTARAQLLAALGRE